MSLVEFIHVAPLLSFLVKEQLKGKGINVYKPESLTHADGSLAHVY